MVKRKWMYLLFAIGIIVWLSGCGGGEGTAGDAQTNKQSNPAQTKQANNQSNASQNEPEATQKEAEKTEVVVYSANGAYMDEYYRDFEQFIEEALPHIEITLFSAREDESKHIDNLILTGQNIDLYYNSIGGFFSVAQEYDLAYDLSDMIKENDIDLSRFEPTLINALTEFGNGEIWGLPVFTTVMTLYYNKGIFDQFGVEYLTDGMTWDEVYDKNRLLSRIDDNKIYTGVAVSPSHFMQMNNLSMPFIDPETNKSTLDRAEEWRMILDPLIRPAQEAAYRAKIEEKGGLPYSGEFSKEKDLAIFGIFHNWWVNNDQTDVDWDLVSYPTFPDKPGVGSQLYPTFYGIPKFAENKEGALEVLQYLTSDEFQMILSKRGEMAVVQTPEVVEAFGSESISSHRNLQAVYVNSFAPIAFKHPHEGTVRKIIQDKLVDIALGNIDINTALRNMKEEADLELEAAMK